MGLPAARISDMHVCPMLTPGVPPIPHVGGPILMPIVPNVLIGGLPAAVVGSMCLCVGPPDSIVKGSLGVMIGGRPAARMGDMTAHGGTIVMGCPTVLIGDISPNSSSSMLATLKSPCATIKDLQETNDAIDKFEAKKDPPPTPEERKQAEAAKQKQADLQKELGNSVRSNLGSVPPEQRAEMLQTAEHYQKTSDALDNAKLSAAVYDGSTPLGYKKVEGAELNDKFGLRDADMKNDDSGFKASVYESTTGKEPKYTAAFAGTEDIAKDGKSDAKQGIGMQDDQYDSAFYVGKKMRTAVGPDGFNTTGHSLGGGLASAASAGTGAKGTTFNAAGLHQNTTARQGIPDSERNTNQTGVDSYQNTSCPLSMAQNNRGKVLTGLSAAAGAIGGFLAGPAGAGFGSGFVAGLGLGGALPKAYGNKIDVQGKSKPLMGHGIGEMVELLNEQTKQDLDKLKNQFGCP